VNFDTPNLGTKHSHIQENRVMMLNNCTIIIKYNGWIIICCAPYGLTTIFKDKTAAVLLHVTTVAKEAMRLVWTAGIDLVKTLCTLIV
jgi:hypothetical protein